MASRVSKVVRDCSAAEATRASSSEPGHRKCRFEGAIRQTHVPGELNRSEVCSSFEKHSTGFKSFWAQKQCAAGTTIGQNQPRTRQHSEQTCQAYEIDFTRYQHARLCRKGALDLPAPATITKSATLKKLEQLVIAQAGRGRPPVTTLDSSPPCRGIQSLSIRGVCGVSRHHRMLLRPLVRVRNTSTTASLTRPW